uniref:Uncharacterized protein n=1 Tax=Arundo donax TaxID=35708 RepID=A0A0A9DPN6_ARUDO
MSPLASTSTYILTRACTISARALTVEACIFLHTSLLKCSKFKLSSPAMFLKFKPSMNVTFLHSSSRTL